MCKDSTITEKQVEFLMKKKNTVADKPEFYFNKAQKEGRRNNRFVSFTCNQ